MVPGDEGRRVGGALPGQLRRGGLVHVSRLEMNRFICEVTKTSAVKSNTR